MELQKVTRVDLDFQAARSLYNSGHYRKVIEAVQPWVQHHDRDVQSRALHFIIASYRCLSEFTRALAFIDHFFDQVSETYQGQMLVDRAAILSLQGRWEAATEGYTRYLDRFGAKSEWAPDCHLSIGWCHNRLGQYDRGRFFTGKAIRGFKRAGQYLGMMRAYEMLAENLLDLGDRSGAAKALTRLMDLLHENPSTRFHANIFLMKVRLALDLGDDKTAEAYLDQAFDGLDSGNGDPQERAQIAWGAYFRAQLLARRGSRAQATEHALRSLAWARELPFASSLQSKAAALIRSCQI